MEWISGYPSCLFSISKAAVAQWIEYRPPKPRVVGSIPASRATKHKMYAKFGFRYFLLIQSG